MSESTAYDRVIEALKDTGLTVSTNGSSSRAKCPAHNGTSNNSLILTDAPDQVLVYCHAGCSHTDIAAALNLTEKDLFNKPGGVTYEYSGGRKVRRRPGKSFSQSGNTKDTSLFQVEDIGDAETVYVTEGEKDALNIAHIYKAAAVSPAQGAGTSPEKFDWTPLSGKDVIIVADKDEAGRNHARTVAAHIKSITKSVEIRESEVGKDVSDHIAAGKKLDELVKRSVLDDLSVTSEWLETQTFPELEEIVPGLIVEGVTVLAGPPKVGKSFLVGNLAIAVVSGGKALGIIDVSKRPVLVLALEDGHRRLQSRYRQINGGPIPSGIKFVIKATPAECVEVIEDYLERYGDQKPLIILDTLGKVKRQKQSGEEAYLVDYEVGGKFKELADSCPGSAIVIIHHTRKADSADFVDLVSGTHGIAGSVDAVIAVQRKRGETDAVLSVTGRDVMEGEYALTVKDGYLWQIDGDDLNAASEQMNVRRNEAERAKRVAKLGPDMRKVLELVNERGNITSEAIVFKLKLTPNRLSQITTRLVEGDFIVRTGRGEYHSRAYEDAHPLIGGGASGVFGGSEVSDTPDTPDTPLTTDTSLTPDDGVPQRATNTCRCGAPLTQPTSIERGICAECRMKRET